MPDLAFKQSPGTHRGIEADQRRRDDDGVGVMERLKFLRGTAPGKFRVDSGPEFVSRVLDHWAYTNGVTLDFFRPGKPTDNAFVESFNDHKHKKL